MKYVTFIIYSLCYIIYFMLFSKELYTGGHIIELYYPLGILVGIIVTVFLKRKLKINDIKRLVTGFTFGTSLLIIMPLALDVAYGSIMSDFYMGGYQNLFQIAEYVQQEDNLVIIHLKKLQEGVFAHNIQNGRTVMSDNRVIQGTYFINEKEYIIFDWDKREIINRKTADEIGQLAHEYIINKQDFNQEYYGDILKYEMNGYGVFFWCEQNNFSLELHIKDNDYYFEDSLI